MTQVGNVLIDGTRTGLQHHYLRLVLVDTHERSSITLALHLARELKLVIATSQFEGFAL